MKGGHAADDASEEDAVADDRFEQVGFAATWCVPAVATQMLWASIILPTIRRQPLAFRPWPAFSPKRSPAARFAKNRRTKVQSIPPDVAAEVRAYLENKSAGSPIWGGTWASCHRGAEMLRGDLLAVGIPYVVKGPEGPLYADFHALRHTMLTLGGLAGIDLRTLQELAGHSKPELTARYSHRRLNDLSGAIEKLPNFLVPSQSKEGAIPAVEESRLAPCLLDPEGIPATSGTFGVGNPPAEPVGGK